MIMAAKFIINLFIEMKNISNNLIIIFLIQLYYKSRSKVVIIVHGLIIKIVIVHGLMITIIIVH